MVIASHQDADTAHVAVEVEACFGTPPENMWAAICSVDAAVYGDSAWSVCQPETELLLRELGGSYAIATEGLSVVGLSSIVAVTRAFADELLQAEYEARDLAPDDMARCDSAGDTWYSTSTCLLPAWRRRGLGTRLLAVSLGRVAKECADTRALRVVAQMWSEGGRATYAKFGAKDAPPASMVLQAPPALLARRCAMLLQPGPPSQ